MIANYTRLTLVLPSDDKPNEGMEGGEAKGETFLLNGVDGKGESEYVGAAG